MVWGSDEGACQTWAGSRTQGTHSGDNMSYLGQRLSWNDSGGSGKLAGEKTVLNTLLLPQ